MSIFEIVQLVFTALSLCGAAFSWWYANRSKKAKREIQAAERRAVESVEQQKKLAKEAQAMREIAEHRLQQQQSMLDETRQIIAAIRDSTRELKGPRFTLSRPTSKRGVNWRLTNNWATPAKGISILNRDSFTGNLPADGFNLAPGQAISLDIRNHLFSATTMPETLVIKCMGDTYILDTL